jgi:hypothetical protein
MIKAVPMTIFEWICIKYKEQRRDEGEVYTGIWTHLHCQVIVPI